MLRKRRLTCEICSYGSKWSVEQKSKLYHRVDKLRKKTRIFQLFKLATSSYTWILLCLRK